MSYLFVPENFKAPFQVDANQFVLRKLTVDEVEKDYEAVMSSKESLRQIFSENDDWPSDTMTIKDNYNDLLEHQNEFDNNKGFAYTVVKPDDSKCIGCLYIYPFSLGVYDSQIYYWLIDEVNEELGESFRAFIDQWIPETFKLNKNAFPGRDLSHQEFRKIVADLKKKSLS